MSVWRWLTRLITSTVSQAIRVTGKWGEPFFDSLTKYCRIDAGYAALSDVETKTRKDEMESFFFETLKYLFLLYAPPETLDLSRVVFNPEAHPIRRTW
jgi:hypothetical protein